MLHLASLVAALSTTPAPDDARPASAPQAAPAPRVPDTSFIGGLGVAGGDTHGGMAFSALATHRFSVVELGVELDTSLLFSAMAGAGIVGGLRVGNDFSVRLLGAGGVHHYAGIGRGLLSDDPGVKGNTPYAGGRLVLGYRFRVSNPGRRPFIGVLGGIDQDLDQREQTVAYWEDNWFGGGTSQHSSTHHLGQTTYGALVVGGIELDLAPY